MGSGVPLPPELTNNTVTRLITIDEALLFVVVGAVAEMLDYWKFTQTGTLTVEQAREQLQKVLYDLLEIEE